ncbi:DUF2339 domain-containing protein [Bacillus sp. FJAT-45350]|uniref:DUF2339 domain-containing protein n=1 Tax=Bacillus sp. FJAT-45350 TaxID=2011014 RepID=UPI000BB7EBCA|nr:DUF2339 domain-containing protein [Bacillus sp. FJAT-45350]
MNDQERIHALEKRVEKLEEELASIKSSQSSNVPTINKKRPITVQKNINKKVITKKNEKDWEKEFGQVWLPRIFIFVLLIGVIWAFKAGTELGLINEYVRVVAGFLAGGAMLLVGHIQSKKQHYVLSQVLLGGGVALFFVTTFSAHVLYGFLTLLLAFSIHVAVVALGLYLTIRYQSQSIGIVSSIGGFLVPFILNSSSGNVIFFVSYELLIFVAFMYIATRRQLNRLYSVIIYGLHFAFLAFSVFEPMSNIITFGAIIQHVMLLLYFLFGYDLKKENSFAVLSTSVFVALWAITSFNEFGYTFILLSMSIIYVVLALVIKRGNEVKAVLLSSVALILLIFFMKQYEASLGLLLLVQGAIVTYLGYRLFSKIQKFIGLVIYGIGLLFTLMNPIGAFISIEFVSWSVLMITLAGLYVLIKSALPKKNDVIIPVKVAITIIGLLYISQLAQLLTVNVGTTLEPMVLSISWLLYAALLIVYGFYREDKVIRVVGIALILFTLLKVILIDLPTVSIVVRALLFLVLGTIGVAVSRLFYRKKS